MSHELLRAAIETAIRRRDPKACARVEPVASRFVASAETASDEGVCSGVLGDTADEALRRLARGVGLRIDKCPACNGRGRRAYERETEDGCDTCGCEGVVVIDPAEEAERLRAELAEAIEEIKAARFILGRGCAR